MYRPERSASARWSALSRQSASSGSGSQTSVRREASDGIVHGLTLDLLSHLAEAPLPDRGEPAGCCVVDGPGPSHALDR